MPRKIQASRVLDDLLASDKVNFVLEGGSRSTKTWSIIQWLLLYCQKNQGKEIVISRDRLTWLKATVFKDFKDILKDVGWWRDANWNKSEMTYELHGNLFTFMSLEEPAKLHGLKTDIFWINEAIGTPGSAFNPTKEVFDQLEMRNTEGWFMDYNPKVTDHWIYNSVLTRPDVHWIHSTQLDNPFLSEKNRQKIMSYEPTEENIRRGTADRVKWLIYGKGERAQHEGLIFTNIQYVSVIPQEAKLIAYGLDFGFTNDVSALIKVSLSGGELWLEQIIYETGLTNDDLSRRFQKAGLKTNEEIIADSAEQKSIAELKAKGWNIKAVVKGKDSIQFGIDILKKYKLNILDRSEGIKQEAENYVWKEDPHTGKSTNVPIDDYNHAWDACFTGDTLVSTKRGNVKIEDIEEGKDFVLTSDGYREVVKKFNNGTKIIVEYCLHFDSFYLTLRATSNHKVKTYKGWVPISELKSGHLVFLNSLSMGNHINYTQESDIFHEEQSECTPQYGSISTEKYLPDSMCITRMKTHGTIDRKTLNSSPSTNIFPSTQSEICNAPNILKSLPRQGYGQQRNGTSQTRAESGTDNMQRHLSSSESLNRHVHNAERNMSTGHHTQEVNTVIRTARLKHLDRGASYSAQVYDLSVNKVHEYFANGLLVHNCRYVAMMKLSSVRSVTIAKTF